MATPELRHMLRDDDLNHEEQKQVLELAINSDKIQDNMTGTFDMRQKDGQVIFDQDTRK